MKRRELDRLILGRRVRISTQAHTGPEHRLRMAVAEKLLRAGHGRTVLSLESGELTWDQLLEADRQGRLYEIAQDKALAISIGFALDRHFDPDEADPTTRRYRASMHKLLRTRYVAAEWRLPDLEHVDWPGLMERWNGSPADWNHLRRAISRLLSLVAGKRHPLRARIMDRIPTQTETPRLVDLEVEVLHRIADALPSHSRPILLAFASVGWRGSEYVRTTEAHLGRYLLHIPGQKTRYSDRDLVVDPRVWPWVETAVRAPLTIETLRLHLRSACQAIGAPALHVHDLRHVTQQLAEEAGIPTGAIRYMMGHAPGSVSEGYGQAPWRAKHARKLADQLAGLFEGSLVFAAHPHSETHSKEASQ